MAFRRSGALGGLGAGGTLHCSPGVTVGGGCPAGRSPSPKASLMMPWRHHLAVKVLLGTIRFPVFLPPKLVAPSYKNFTSVVVSAALQTERKASTKLNTSGALGRVLSKLLSVSFG